MLLDKTIIFIDGFPDVLAFKSKIEHREIEPEPVNYFYTLHELLAPHEAHDSHMTKTAQKKNDICNMFFGYRYFSAVSLCFRWCYISGWRLQGFR